MLLHPDVGSPKVLLLVMTCLRQDYETAHLLHDKFLEVYSDTARDTKQRNRKAKAIERITNALVRRRWSLGPQILSRRGALMFAG